MLSWMLTFARVRNASDIGAEVNHLWPLRKYAAPGPALLGSIGVAVVMLARTSWPAGEGRGE